MRHDRGRPPGGETPQAKAIGAEIKERVALKRIFIREDIHNEFLVINLLPVSWGIVELGIGFCLNSQAMLFSLIFGDLLIPFYVRYSKKQNPFP